MVVTVCEYCESALILDEQGVRDSGRKSRLPQGFTRLYTGATGLVRNHRFRVLGRIRYSYGRGFWDEWAVELEGSGGVWITEDDHELALEQPGQRVPLGEFSAFSPGNKVQILGKEVVIEEIGEATCVAVEGSLPIPALPGETYRFADGTTPDGRYTVSIEWDEDTPMVHVGHWLNHETLQLDDDGAPW